MEPILLSGFILFIACVICVSSIGDKAIVVTFTQSPNVGFKASKLSVFGCEYNSPVEIKEEFVYYILKNSQGTLRLNATSPIKKPNGVWTIPPSGEIASFSSFGTYHCVVYDPVQMCEPIISNATTTDRFLPRFMIDDVPQRSYLIGGSFQIDGCQIQSPFISGLNIYWQKDGVRYREGSARLIGALRDTGFQQYRMDNLIERKAMINASGSYSCAFDLRNITIANITCANTTWTQIKENITISYLKPKFLDIPKLVVTTNTYKISGCRYQAAEDLIDHAYLLLNGSRTNLARSTDRVRELRKRRSTMQRDRIFPNFQIPGYNYTGYFQCAVYDPDRMEKPIFSNLSEFVTLKGPTLHLRASTTITKNAGSIFTIPGCFLVNNRLPLKILRQYWLKNDVEKILVNETNTSGIDGGPPPVGGLPLPPLEGLDLHPVLVVPKRPLTFNGVTLHEDNSTYRCVFEIDGVNEPIQSNAIKLSVKAIQLKFIDVSPTVENRGTSIMVKNCQYTSSENRNNFIMYQFTHTNGSVSVVKPNEPGSPWSTSRFTVDKEQNIYLAPYFNILSYDQLAGKYTCGIFDPRFVPTPIKSVAAISKFHLQVRFQNTLKPVNATVGSYVELSECLFESLFEKGVKAYWLKDGQRIFSSSNHFNMSSNVDGIKVFRTSQYSFRATINDSGIYQCSLDIGNMTIINSPEVPFNIEYIKAEFISNPALINHGNGKHAIGGCLYKSQMDLANYTYVLLNGTRLNRTFPATPVYNRVVRGQFQLIPFEIGSYLDSGVYRCVIDVPLRMLEPVVSNSTSIKIPAPQFEDARDITQTAHVMRYSKLTGCMVKHPLIVFKYGEFYWLKNGNTKIFANLSSADAAQDDFAFLFPDLVMNKTTFSDEAAYQCVLHPNGMPPIISKQIIRLVVKELTVVVKSKPYEFHRNDSNSKEILVAGCRFQSTSDVHNFTYLVVSSKDKEIRRINKTEFTPCNSTVENITDCYLLTSFDDVDVSYQCGVFVPGQMRQPLLSNKTEVKIPAVSYPLFNEVTSSYSPARAGSFITIKGCPFLSIFSKGMKAFWYKNGKVFKPAEYDVQQKRNFDNYKMVFRDLHFESVTLDDEGSYHCLITTYASGPYISESVNITIQEVEVTFLSPPSLRVTEDGVYLIGCQYETLINLNRYASLLFNGTTEERVSKEIVASQRNANGSFQIQTAQVYMIGSYQCILQHPRIKGYKKVSGKSNFQGLQASKLLPVFTAGPSIQHPSKAGPPIVFVGCTLSSKVMLDNSNAYWLRNGHHKIPGQIRRINADQEGQTKIYYRFDTHEITRSNYTDHGYYQCLVNVPGEFGGEVLSSESDVQFTDVATTELKIRMNKSWGEELKDRESLKFKQLEKEIIAQIEKNIVAKNTQKSIVRILEFSEGSVIATTQILLTNVSSVERQNECKSSEAIGEQIQKTQSLDVTSVNSRSLDCCLNDTSGETSFKGTYRYSNTLVSTTIKNNCTYTSSFQQTSSTNTRTCQGDLRRGPNWSDISLERCPAKTQTTNDLIHLNSISVCINDTRNKCSSPLEISTNLSTIVSSNGIITIRQDIQYIDNILRHVINAPSTFNTNNSQQVETIAENIIRTVNILLITERQIIAAAERTTQSSTSILKSLDQFAQRLGEYVSQKKTTISVSEENIALTVSYLEPSYVEIIAVQQQDKASKADQQQSKINLTITTKTTTDKNDQNENIKRSPFLSASEIPLEAFNKTAKVVQSFFFRYDTLFQGVSAASNQLTPPLIESNVLDVRIGNEEIENLTQPIKLMFKKVKTFDVNKTVAPRRLCTFWDFDFQTQHPNIKGKWLTRGCVNVKETKDLIHCECDHLTNFAILIDVSQTQNNPLELQIITWIGCGISLAGLFLTLITYLAFPKLRKKLPPKILLCLTISLMILLITFLVGVEKETFDSKRGCQVIAGIIHYFLLSTFFWMAVEAVNLYRNFVKVFGGGSTRKFLKSAFLFAWGVPLIAVVVCGVAASEDFGNERFCVVTGNAFYYGVLLPIAVVLLFNFVVLAMVMRSLTNTKRTMLTNKRNEIRSQLKIAFACSVLLGVTWVFGLLAVGDLRDVFQWLFTVFNSLQGLFIFIFYTVRNTEVIKEWKRVFKLSRDNENTSSLHSDTYTRTTPLTKINTTKIGNTKRKNNVGNISMTDITL